MSERADIVTKIEKELSKPVEQRNKSLIDFWKEELNKFPASKKTIICFHSSFYAVMNTYTVAVVLNTYIAAMMNTYTVAVINTCIVSMMNTYTVAVISTYTVAVI